MLGARDILDLYQLRQRIQSPWHVQMGVVREVYNSEAEVDLPDLPPSQRVPATPNLLAQGVDQTAGRIASVAPMIAFASDNPGNRTADRRAETARRAISAWWQSDKLMLKMRRRARHLIAYAMTPVVVRWNAKEHRPCWEVRDPMQTWPNMDTAEVSPPDIIFAYRRPANWLRMYGYADAVHYLEPNPVAWASTDLLCIEYVDSHQRTLILAGARTSDPWQSQTDPYTAYGGNSGTWATVVLEHSPMDGQMTAFCPLRMTLDSPGGQFDSMIGGYFMQNRLMALEVGAVEKGVYPDTYLESRAGEIARFIDGPYDGRTGKVNIVAGGAIRTMNESPGYMTDRTMDRLERNARVSAGIPAEFGGESNTNIRTGRRGELVMSAQVDFPVGEAQEVLANSLIEENKAAIHLAKMFDGGHAHTFYVGTGNAARPVTFDPAKVFTHDDHVISYPVAGTDINGLVMGLGQRVGMGTMSKETAASLDPYIDSPELEHDRIIGEGLEQALVAGIQQQTAQGAIPPLVVARLIELVKNDKLEIGEAMNKVIEEARAEQEAQQAQQPQAPPQGMSPDAAQQGLGGPIPGANEGQMALGDLMSTLRRAG